MIVLAIMISHDAQSQEDWIYYNSEEVLPFTVYVPGEMEASNQQIKTSIGELNAHTFAYQGTEEDPNYLYLINCIKYPDGTFPEDSTDLIDDYLDSAVESSAEKVSGELVYTADIDKSGKLFRIKYNNGDAVIKGKSFIVNDVFVVIQVFTIQRKSLNDEMDLFLDSFKVRA